MSMNVSTQAPVTARLLQVIGVLPRITRCMNSRFAGLVQIISAVGQPFLHILRLSSLPTLPRSKHISKLLVEMNIDLLIFFLAVEY